MFLTFYIFVRTQFYSPTHNSTVTWRNVFEFTLPAALINICQVLTGLSCFLLFFIFLNYKIFFVIQYLKYCFFPVVVVSNFEFYNVFFFGIFPFCGSGCALMILRWWWWWVFGEKKSNFVQVQVAENLSHFKQK